MVIPRVEDRTRYLPYVGSVAQATVVKELWRGSHSAISKATVDEHGERFGPGAGVSRLGKFVQDSGDPLQRGSVVVGPRASLRDDRNP